MTITLYIFQLQTQESLSQINDEFEIEVLKFPLSEVNGEDFFWRTTKSLTIGNFSQDLQKLPQFIKLFLKLYQHGLTGLFGRFNRKDYVLLTTTSNLLFQGLLSRIFTAVLIFFLPPTNSAFSGSAHSNNSPPAPLTAGTTDLRKIGDTFLTKTSTGELNHILSCRPKPLKHGISTCFETTNFLVFFFRSERWTLFKNKSKFSYNDRYRNVFLKASAKSICKFWKDFLISSLSWRLLNVW